MSSANHNRGTGSRGGRGAWASSPPRGRGGFDSDSRGNNRGGYRGRGISPYGGGDQGRGGGAFRGGGGAFRGERGQGRGFTRGGPPRGGYRGSQQPGLFAADKRAVIDARLQDETQNQVLAKLSSLSLEEKERQSAGEVLPLRPDYGSEGLKEIKLRTNYFPVVVPEVPIFEYEVAITSTGHQKIGASKKRRIFQLAEQTKKWDECGLKDVAHDHVAKILSAKELQDPITIQVDYYSEDEESPPPNAEKFTVVITKLRELALQDLVSHTTGERQYKDFDIAPLLAALNIILASHATSSEGKGVMVGRNKFFFPTPSMVWELGGGLQAFRGFYSSVRPTHYQLMVNVNVCTTAFYRPGNMANAIIEFMNGSFGANPNSYIKPNLKIVVTHFQPPRYKTVKALSDKTARQFKFPCSEFRNNNMSIAEYFEKKYGIILQHPDLPVVDISVGKEKGKILVPAEVYEILPNQAFLGKLSDRHTANMIEMAAQPPNINATAIVDQGLKLLGYAGPSSTRDKFGVKIQPEMAVVPGRILKSPNIEYRQGSKGTPKPDEKASWNMRDVKFAVGGNLENWVVLLIHDGNDEDEFQLQDAKLKEIIKGFKVMCQRSGMQVLGEPRYTEVFLPPRDRSDPLREKAMNSIRAVMSKQTPFPKLVLVLLSDGDKHIYSGIKRLFDTDLDIATVCAHSKKIRNEKGQLQYFANVALKVNMKLGGINHTLDRASMAWLKKEPTMLVGIDVTHPGKGTIRGTPSVAAVVASYNSGYAQYPASMRLQESKVEMVQALDEMMKERLDLFRQINKILPQKILIYRDGVSEGQYQLVLEKELPKIKDAFHKYDTPKKRYEPKLTIVICGKRHHTRFYPTEKVDADSKKYNPLPGTVVDRGVTSIYYFDFFLQSHGGLQGSTKPTHYFVAHDTIGFTADQLQGLTNSVSYMFARATKAVSLVSPAYYADLACERGRCYIHRLLQGYSDGSATTTSSDKDEVMKEARKLWNDGVNGKRLKDTMYYL